MNITREELDGWNPSYRYGKDDSETGRAIDQAVDRVNSLVHGGGIACLDEDGNRVETYTNRVVLELPEGTPKATADAIREGVAEVIRLMNAA